jgi:IS30 family transposase
MVCWEADLIGGTKNGHIATLVERHSRFTLQDISRNPDSLWSVHARGMN